jgi:hypothetical protein
VAAVTRGDPLRLHAYSELMAARVLASRGPLSSYRQAIAALHAAPSDLPVDMPDRSSGIAADLDELEEVDRQPARFAVALTAADRTVSDVPLPFLAGVLARPEAAAASDSAVRRAAEARADADADALLALAVDHLDLEAHDGDLARLLARLDDPLVVAALYERLDADGLLALLRTVERAIEVTYDQALDGNAWIVDHEPMQDLLAPLARSFTAAAAMGALDPAFVDRLLADTTAGNTGDGGATATVSQLLIYGDLLAAGDPHVTAGFASMILGRGYDDAVRRLWGAGSPYVPPGPIDGLEGMFHLEYVVAHAAERLAADPEAAHRFVLDLGNLTALLDRAQRGWWLGADQGASEVLEAGLLVHPHVLGLLDHDLDPRHPVALALGHLVRDVAGRGAVDASAARGLGIVLAPHHASVAAVHDDDVPGPLGLDAVTVRGYLAAVARHGVGMAALEQTFAGWTAARYLHWADELGREPFPTHVDVRFLADTAELRDTYALLEWALRDANVAHEQQHALLVGAIDRAGGMARSRVLQAAKLPSGPVGFAAGEAASWTTRQVTGWAKEQLHAAGPTDVADLQNTLALQMPQLVVGVLVGSVDPDRHDQLVPVPLDPRPVEVERERGGWERLRFWEDPDTEVVMVEFGAWPRDVLDDWMAENEAALGASGSDEDGRWWLGLVVEDVRKGFRERVE